MRRGKQHQSLSRQQELRIQEARRCIRLLHDYYDKDQGSAIDYRLYRNAMATQMVIEGRTYGRFKGLLRLAEAILYQPGKREVWTSSFELCERAVNRIIPTSQLRNQ